MQVNTNRIRPPGVPGEVETQARRATALQSPEAAQFTSSASLNAALSQAPDTRPEEVARARRLVETRSYPPPELIRRISHLLADQLPPSAD
ncbi:MAG TPA: hypothetical protein DCM86_03370 [Verrucomicrobiales bacterium]|nr:hypothetical protein [Verrucomicrobiales bacterium]